MDAVPPARPLPSPELPTTGALTPATTGTPTGAAAPSRLDVALVQQGLARARGQADELVRAGRVLVDGRRAAKASMRVQATSELSVERGAGPDWVGRGALKLASLLDELEASGTPVVVSGRRCLDAGASTGGFTQVLLQRGARLVCALDVGHDQLAPGLVDDPRVEDRSRTSVRGLLADQVGGPVELLVADLSFISAVVVLGDLAGLVAPGGDLVVLVKPQFEVGRARLGSGGVVRDPALRRAAVTAYAEAVLARADWSVLDVRASRWPGPSGNVEYFVWSCRLPQAPGALNGQRLAEAVQRAVDDGPAA